MTEKFEIYKCDICGNTVQVLFSGEGELVCCGEAMKILHPQHKENNELSEKHTPIFETDINGRFIRISEHPMEESHYIKLIEAYPSDKSSLHIKFLKPKEIAEFNVTAFEQELVSTGLCNIHGLWINDGSYEKPNHTSK